MALIRWILGVLITVAVIVFAVSNMQPVPVYPSPFHDAYNMPLYLIALGLLAGGFILGALSVWINSAGTRRTKRRQRKKIRALEKELESMGSKQPSGAGMPARDLFPPLPDTAKSANQKS